MDELDLDLDNNNNNNNNNNNVSDSVKNIKGVIKADKNGFMF